MLVILGLVLLIAALVVGVAGVVTNDGGAHELTGGFSVFGYEVTGSTGTLFLYGIIVGAVALLGLSLLLAGARRTSHRGHDARPRRTTRREAVAADQGREDVVDQRGIARPQTTPEREPNPDGEHRRGLNPFKHRSEPR
ncbi:hypothetical protein OG625_20315 [Streptomyces sp. NBC_01351]|uniref:hypothetical protein n=1 Tax=Streptomyces sp. NBC_01351 TaxID=2903833 RepID=UPI002E32CB51|nr:hypothetical protein [Streptomyces sp. NBC_01351]